MATPSGSISRSRSIPVRPAKPSKYRPSHRPEQVPDTELDQAVVARIQEGDPGHRGRDADAPAMDAAIFEKRRLFTCRQANPLRPSASHLRG
jgi:hypothetical protein